MAAIAAAGLAAVRAVDARPVRGAVRPGRLLPVCGSEEKMADLDHETNNRRGGGYAPRGRGGRR